MSGTAPTNAMGKADQMQSGLTRVLQNLPALRYFHTVALTGSFRAAAEKLNIAASAVNRHVRQLEAAIGLPLFERRSRALTLTDAGETLLRRVTRILDEVAMTGEELADLHRLSPGHVRIGAHDALAREMLPHLILSFASRDPHVRFTIRTGRAPELLAHLGGGRLDMVFVYDAPTDINIRVVREYALETCAVMRHDHPLASRDFVTLHECSAYPLALPDDAAYLNAFRKRLAMREPSGCLPFLTTNSFQIMRDFAARSDLVSLQTPLPAQLCPRNPALSYVRVAEPLARYSLMGCCIMTDDGLSDACRGFLDHGLGILDGALA
ncbi:LysR family transcriptional regulator [Komagataeibacter oboediens]|uniref:LysR family transcriptional regulator n=1 Tax=Komagataeibacter oboediens TaxID=65958 RepID=UPI001C2BB87C|nr:LysR family transcriptional regulator [Komagataeibacter oboediens]MBV0888567.1 LysR family transcriptional regulator [Komagataeibacter oboediens]MBV1825294.1 LysR family transcriptional regulator [Komagataeibacter oboediens]MCK9821068.1 LysR family transcriptional regulator [Komagataeibacter oboediens]WEQ51730.1 LysR family transcriptional regulator [Komagataeibacter oboediens]